MTFIPYEKQQSERMCGAAALCMVYRSLGLAVEQAEVWQAVQGKNALGDPCGDTHLLASDALERGLHALVLKACEPWPALGRCLENGARVVLNHRAATHSWTGHFTVPIQFGDTGVLVHDPQFGPARRISRDDLLTLWQRNISPLCEISGQVLIAFAAQPSDGVVCSECDVPIPESRTCPSCAREVALQPAAVLGCLNDDCPGNVWQTIYCPHCDAGLYRRGDAELAGAEMREAGKGRGGPAGLSAKLIDLADLLRQLQETAPEGPTRKALGGLGRQLDQMHGQLKEVIQGQLANGDQVVEKLRSGLVAMKEEAAERKEAGPRPRKRRALPRPRRRERKSIPNSAAACAGRFSTASPRRATPPNRPAPAKCGKTGRGDAYLVSAGFSGTGRPMRASNIFMSAHTSFFMCGARCGSR